MERGSKIHAEQIITSTEESSDDEIFKWPRDLNNPSLPSQLVIALVGLPARGKSYISKKLQRYLKWIGFDCKIFNAGDYRRKNIGKSQSANFFDPNNEEARQQKRQMAMAALTDALKWLEQPASHVAIFDATNTTKSRRKLIRETCATAGARLLFLETICTEKEILEANYALKLSNADYSGMDAEAARKDFEERVRGYEKIYETIDETELDSCYIKIINTGKQVVSNRCGGFLLSQISMYLQNLHIVPRTIWLTRSGQTIGNVNGKLGGNPSLCAAGRKYSQVLSRFLLDKAADGSIVWTSTLNRSIETIMPLKDTRFSDRCFQTHLLNDIHAGVCEGMTYDEISEQYPSDWEARTKDKLRFRYQGGESYLDLGERVKPLILELERLRHSVVVVAHQAVLRLLLGYFTETPQDEMPVIDVPLHAVMELKVTPFGCHLIKHALDVPLQLPITKQPVRLSSKL